MIPAEEAFRLIAAHSPALPAESAPLSEACGRVLAEDLLAREDLPSFDNSAMDGYAVSGPAESWRVRETLPAGSRPPAPLADGEAARVMTGAPVPPGAAAVVMRELVSDRPDGRVSSARPPRPGENIRPRGEDVRAGEALLSRGHRLRPYEVGLLAAQGWVDVPVHRRPRVAVLSTGDELVDAASSLRPGQIRNSNGPALAAAVARWGAVPVPRGAAADDPVLLRSAFSSALAAADVLLVTGGVSVGDFDHTRSALEEIGVRTVFWRVAMKPGKPLYFGTSGEKLVFGLPGNPVAALVCVEEFIRPALETMQGFSPGHPSYHLEGVLENDYPKEPGRRLYLFCRASGEDGGFRLRALRPQGSAMLGMARHANALAVVPVDSAGIKVGDRLAFRWLK
jgi:molybdopterin molybdotransferase